MLHTVLDCFAHLEAERSTLKCHILWIFPRNLFYIKISAQAVLSYVTSCSLISNKNQLEYKMNLKYGTFINL